MNKTLEEIKKEFLSRFDYSLIESVIRDMGDDATWLTMRDNIWQFIESTISQTKQELVEEIKKTIEKKKDDLIAQEKFCSNCIKERDEEDDELTGEIEPCQTHLISWFNIQTLEELLEDLKN